jgi:magnesium transporter
MSRSSPLKLAFARRHPEGLAAHLAGKSHEELLTALHGLPVDAGAAVIARLPHGQLVRLLASQSDETVASWLTQAAVDDALTIVLHLEESRRSSVLAKLPTRHMRRTLERLVVYPQKTVGALIDPTVVRLAASTSLGQAIDTLRADPDSPQEWIWIVDDEGRYVGLLDLGRALLAQSARFEVGELALRIEPLRAETALAAARDVDEWLSYAELPVVDHLNHLLGALSRQRLMQALAAERPQDFGILDGVTALANQYFRVLGLCLRDLLGQGRPS